MSYPSTTRTHVPNKALTDIITYRYNGELVYVPLASNYIQALSHAREVFPQLKKLRDASLSLSLNAPAHCVNISALAWPKLITHLARYQIVDVHATPTQERRDGADGASIPHITITYADTDGADDDAGAPLPPYFPLDIVDGEKAPYVQTPRSSSPSLPLLRSPSPSPSLLHPGKRNWFLQKLHGAC